MDSMLERWKDAFNAVDSKPSSPPLPNPSKHSQDHPLKKSLEKSKRSLHSNQAKMHQSRRTVTPSKKKNKKSKNDWLQKFKQEILVVVGKGQNEKNMGAKIVGILEAVWAKASEETQKGICQSHTHIPSQMQISSMQQSTLSTTAKKHEKLYHQIQKKYFQCEKQRQFLKGKVDSLVKKYEQVDKQLQRYGKMQRLIDSCLQRQDQVKQQNKKLKQQLHLASLREIQQQKIFQKQIVLVHELVESIRKNLPQQ